MENLNRNAAVCFWSWNGFITEEGIRAQLEDFADGKLFGVIIHARAGLKVPYLSEEWFRLFAYATECAKRLGLEVWIYDEEGWPSGFAGGRVSALGVDYCHKSLHYSDCYTASPEKSVLAVFEKRNGEYCRISDENAEIGNLVFWYERDAHYVDLLNPQVTESFLQITHEAYYQRLKPYFGNTVKGFFVDEPQMNTRGYPWSCVLEEAYRKRTERDLLNDLWRLAEKDESCNDFRDAFWQLVADLYEENFVKKVTAWCAEHGVALTGHFPEEDGLCNQLASCGEIMRNYRFMQLPGIDHLGSRVASPVLMKQVSSVSRQYADGCVLSETFGCAGWGVSFRQLQWIWGGQSVLGITKPCYHLSAYTIEGRCKRDYPAFYSAQEPWWKDFPSFANWMERLNGLMTEGTRAIHTLVLPPLTDIRRNYFDTEHRQDELRRISSQFRVLLENLLDIQLDFDLGDEYLLMKDGTVNSNGLTLGKQTYDTVILSETVRLPENICNLLKRFSAQGGRLIAVGRLPECLEDQNSDIPVLANRRDTLEKYVEYYDLERPVLAVKTSNLRPASNIRTHVRRLENGYRVHLWASDEFENQKILFSLCRKCRAEEVDLLTGERSALPVMDDVGGSLIPMTVCGQENRVVDFVLTESVEETAHALQQRASKTVVSVVVQPKEPNALTLDYARFSTDGGQTFSECKAIVNLLDDIYADLKQDVTETVVRYCFDCNSQLNRAGLRFATEDRNVKKIVVNGKLFSAKRCDFWIEPCFGVYEFGDSLCAGENTIDLYFDIPRRGTSADLRAVYETEINRFSYPVEPDNVYILGDFDAVSGGKVFDRAFCYRIDDHFRLCPATPKHLGDLTVQNMWFYRGNAEYRFTADFSEERNRITVAYDGVAVALTVDGKRRICHKNPAVFEVEMFQKPQEVILELFGHNRNLLGPHHHVYGENYLIGPAVYEGKWDVLTGFMNPALYGRSLWTDQYGVIPFGIREIKLEYLNEFWEE